MIKIVNLLLFILIVFICCSCRKKTTIDVKVFNYALDEKVVGATVVLIEREEKDFFSSAASCKEIATATSDENGNCSFDKEKLKTNAKYNYYLGIKEAYGLNGTYPCAGKTSGFIKVGDSQNQILNADVFDGYLRIQYNNLLSPSQPNDSLIVSLSTIAYPNPKGGVVQGGGGVFGGGAWYGIGNPPPSHSPIILTDPIKTKAQRLLRYVRKHKLGIISVQIDTIKIYPNTTTIVEINW